MDLAPDIREQESDFAFRPVQYLGSKWRIREQLAEVIETVAPAASVVHDLFAGTGVVSAQVATAHPVVATDVQEYSRVLTSALTSPLEIDWSEWFEAARQLMAGWVNALGIGPLLDREEDVLLGEAYEELATMISAGSIAAAWEASRPHWADSLLGVSPRTHRLPTMFSFYGGVYFGYRQALFLDALAVTARARVSQQRDTCLAVVLSLASEIATSIGGHFAQPARVLDRAGNLKLGLLRSITRSRSVPMEVRAQRVAAQYARLSPTRFPVRAARMDYSEALLSVDSGSGCVYADPPYTRDHYSRFYHVLETIALGDEPGLTKTVTGGRSAPSRGLYRLDRHQSPFSIVSEAPKAFDSLFEAVLSRGCPLVMSYSPVAITEKPRARTIDLEDLVSIARRYASSVDVLPIEGVTHARLNRKDLSVRAPEYAEVLITALP